MDDKNNGQQLAVFDRLSKGNQFVFYVYRKVVKVSSALYLITDLIKDIEPLKWQLRKLATEAMSLSNFATEKTVFYNLEQALLDIEGTLELGKISRVISEMNCLLLQNEIRKLLLEMRERSKEGFFASELASNFFEVAKPAPLSLEDILGRNEEKKEDLYKGHKRHDVRYARPQAPERSGGGRDFNNFESKGQRKDEIMTIVKEKGEVTIKDITTLIKDCSEKTIQRELLALVDQRLLKKTGERRWSRYSLPR